MLAMLAVTRAKFGPPITLDEATEPLAAVYEILLVPSIKCDTSAIICTCGVMLVRTKALDGKFKVTVV
jgi:hypothetical protein